MTEEEQRIERQKSEWIAKKKRITGLVESVNVSNVEIVADQIMKDDIVRARGLFCQEIMKSQSVYPELSDVYASLAAVINSEFPEVGLLLVKRLVLEFKDAFDCRETVKMQPAAKFLAHLVNQGVVYAVLGVDIMLLLLYDASSDNVEVAVSVCTECVSTLKEVEPYKLKEILREFRGVSTSGALKKRVQLSIMQLLAAKRSNFKDYPSVIDELDLVKDHEGAVTHDIFLFENIDPETSVNEYDPNFQCDGICKQLKSRFRI